jgi:hypothetical protein
VEILFGIIVIVLLVLILASVLGGEEGFVMTAMAGLGCAGVSCFVVASIAFILVGIFVLLVMFK